jgi:shikimate kinase
MAECKKILIAGFSGSGKTSLLKKLQELAPADWEHFSDLDELVLKTAPRYQKLAELIEDLGWESFRLKERQALESWLKQEGKGVLALGGGSLSPLIWELYGKQPSLRWVHLEVPFDICLKRMKFDSLSTRPLLKRPENELRELFSEREKLFRQIPFRLNNSEQARLSELAAEFWRKLT